MTKEFFCGNRNRLYTQMKDHSLPVLFSGTEVRKTNPDEASELSGIGQAGFAADFEDTMRRGFAAFSS